VIGYAVGRNEQEFVRQQRAIERVCGERGWKLTAVVKERDDRSRKRRARPGRKHVLAQVATGGVGQLVVGRLHSLAGSPAELAVVLEWCRRREVGLVALDVGLDTTTPDGRVAARCLGALVTRSARTSGAH
jgi:DNA invertase Pin-like site-specific DNA recombinase